MTREVREALDAHRKFVILEYAQAIGKVNDTCRDFGVARSTFYRWRRAYEREGKAGLLREKAGCQHRRRGHKLEHFEGPLLI